MNCPKCGAVNPEGAEHCNLCFFGFVERTEPEPTLKPEEPADGARTGTPIDRFLTKNVLRQSWQGGLAALAGGLLFLVSLGLLQAIGVTVLSFIFENIGINVSNLAFFILAAGVFAAFCGGVGGNLDGKRDAVPVVRMMAGFIGLGIWVGLLFSFKPADLSVILWLTDGLPGVLVALAVFPLAAVFIGASESFGEDLDFSRAGYGAAGGLVAGLATAAFAGLVLLAVPLFGTANPAGVFAIAFFSLKLSIAVCLIGFVFGAGLWLGIGVADELI